MKTIKRLNRKLQPVMLLLVLSALLSSAPLRAEQDEYSDLNQPQKRSSYAEKSSWALAFDNDILVPGTRDQDYTYGLNITYAGREAEQQWASLHDSLDWLNRELGLGQFDANAIEAYKIEYGLFGFTPEDITLSMANPDDRPYASLVYVSSSREAFFPERELSWQSTLTVGFLGLDIVGDIQNLVHSSYGGNIPEGWDNQISDGGEPTLRYSLSRQSLLYSAGNRLEIKHTLQGSIGYITEASWGISLRAGKIRTPWISFNPELVSYGEKAIPTTLAGVSEQYFWAGLALKYRAYNAFLEGQFRDSAVTYEDDAINRGIVEAWLGYTVALADGYSFTYSIRAHSSEINRGQGDRNLVWGGILISKTLG